MISLTGNPCASVNGSPFREYASSGDGFSAFSSVMLRPNCWSTLKVCCRNPTSCGPRSAPKKTTSRALELTPTCFNTSLNLTPLNKPQEDRPCTDRGLLPEHS